MILKEIKTGHTGGGSNGIKTIVKSVKIDDESNTKEV
jgi:hypothetical protein